jgi:hypothetical protein
LSWQRDSVRPLMHLEAPKHLSWVPRRYTAALATPVEVELMATPQAAVSTGVAWPSAC